MSHLAMKRRRTESVKSKLYSEQSPKIAPRHSITRILNDSISKRRFTTHNSPDNASVSLHLELKEAKQQYKNKNTKNAILLLKKLYIKYPQNKEILYFLGSCQLNENNYEQALHYFKTALTLGHSNRNIYIYMAICYKAMDRLKDALDILEAACQANHKFKDAYFYKGKIHAKRKEFHEASGCFQKCLKIDEGDQLAVFMLADSLRNLGLIEDALQKFDQLEKNSEKCGQKAALKKIQVLIEMKRPEQAKQGIIEWQSKTDSIQLTFLKGLCEYELGNYNDSITFLQLSLSSNISEPYLTRALKLLLQIKIQEKDFFGAEHLITRAMFTNKNQEDLQVYYKLVVAVNDLIKRKTTESEASLKQVYTNSVNLSTDSQKFLNQISSSFYAYALFSLEKYEEALEVYRKAKTKTQSVRKVEDYNILICEGIVLHKKKNYGFADEKFRLASKVLTNKVEPFFLICVNAIQENKYAMTNDQVKKKVFQRLAKEFKTVEKMEPQSPLFLFYQSLVLLYQGLDATETIQKAIQCSEEEISEYFFIQALALSFNGLSLKALQSINKAIELDQTIPEFFKERSKYYYVLQRYDDAIKDILHTLDQTRDDEGKLLLTFYYYMIHQYAPSLQILKEVSEDCVQQKFKQFQMALNFRLLRYNNCGAAGVLLNSIINRTAIDIDQLEVIVNAHINQRHNYSEFNVYFFHLLLSAYYFYRGHFDSCLEHLFGALEEMQLSAEGEEDSAALSELLLNQIKFNITIASLLKQSLSQSTERKYQDTAKYIAMFMKETIDTDFIKVMTKLIQLIRLGNEMSIEQAPMSIQNVDIYDDMSKVSDNLPDVTIHLTDYFSFRTKFLILYPQKLKFNIFPEFDQSFLFNFDVDKIQSKLCPPWFKLHEGQLIFTQKIRNQSVMISESQKPQTPSLLMSPSPPMPQSLREKFKLDDAVQRKLQKLAQINKKKDSTKRVHSALQK